jgi:hypothetical protein
MTNHFYKNVFFSLITVMGLLSCNLNPMKIIPLQMLNEVDTINHNGDISVTSKIDYYLVENYNSEKSEEAISQFVASHLDSNNLKFDQYDMVFYEESQEMNVDFINKLPENLKYKAAIDKIPIKTYTWFSGRLVIH